MNDPLTMNELIGLLALLVGIFALGFALGRRSGL